VYQLALEDIQMQDRVRLLLPLLVLVTGAGCADGVSSGRQSESEAEVRGSQRTLILANRGEPPQLASRRVGTSGSLTWGFTLRLPNAYLSLTDANGQVLPYLSESLPTLNSDTWRIAPDGSMETIYRLRSGLSWHDGAPLTADDFVAAWRLYSIPEMGQMSDVPLKFMSDVLAIDDRTVVIRWHASFPDADRIDTDFPPLPKHILDAPLRDALSSGNYESLINQRFWSSEYIGAGPFKLDRWEPGAFLELSAFDGHTLGRPKIGRIRVQFMGDSNVVLAGLLSGDISASIDDSIRFEQASVLRSQWGDRGVVIMTPTQQRYTYMQLNPAYQRPASLGDLRVRRALAHTIDRDMLNEGLFQGNGQMSDTMVPSAAPVYPLVERTIAHYPYDPRRAEQLMNEAGYTRESDGYFSHPVHGRFDSEYRVLDSANNVAEATILSDLWRRVGFNIQQAVFTPQQASDNESRATYAGLSSTSGSGLTYPFTIATWHSSQVPTAQNRWRGSNRSGWSNPEYDRLSDALATTLDRSTRDQIVLSALKLLHDEVPYHTLYFGLGVLAYDRGLSGPRVTVPETNYSWDIHTWDWQ
jgi:peptide/nickel transport system substrate-binding protein